MRSIPVSAFASLRRQPDLALGLVILLLLAVLAGAPGLLAIQSPFAIDVDRTLDPPSALHWFGTDDVGRDVFARVAFGARVTLSICAGALGLSAIVGGVLGLVAGFLGGWLDLVCSRVVDVVLSFPPLILGVMVTGTLGADAFNLALALAVVYAPTFFRIARSGALVESNLAYVEAARSVGLSEGAILVRHVARNVLPILLVQYVVMFPLVLQIQAAMGFLGLGVQPPTPDWGAILQTGKDYVLLAPWMSAFPGAAVLITAAALTLVGRAISRQLDRR